MMRRNSKILLSSLGLFLLLFYALSLLTTNGVLHNKGKVGEVGMVVAVNDIEQDSSVPDWQLHLQKEQSHQQHPNSEVQLTQENPYHFDRVVGVHGEVNQGQGNEGNGKKLLIPYKVVHLDFKGAPPKLEYLFSLFPLMKEAGGNAVLIEYEDMFPYEGVLNGSAHGKHFTKEEVKSLLKAAADNDLEVIPLIQTFGHLEFVLKLEKFSNLREVDEFPQEICPSNDKSWEMVKAIIDQVMALHPKINYIHIGCDEVYHLGECEKCRKKGQKDVFINHVVRVAKYIKKTYRKNSIIWDDMLRKYYTEDLAKSEIGDVVEPMIWDYTENVDHLVSPYLWPMYGSIFKNIWVASAFKGAFGETLYQVDIQRHAMNQLSWIKTVQRESPRIANFRGVVITGWSRYDHFAVLCELLPPAVPSLILSLLLLKDQSLHVASKHFQKLFKCDFNGEFVQVEDCVWNGKDVFASLGILKYYESQVKSLDKIKKGWVTDYSVAHNYTSPWRLEEPLQTVVQYLNSVRSFEGNMKSTLRNYFEEYVVSEWVEQKILPIKITLNKLLNDIKSLRGRRVWQKRPI